MNEYRVTSKVMGTVRDILDWCAIIELADGKLGRIPVSEISWSKQHKHPRELLSVGQEIEVVITGVDRAQERISLSLKAAKGDPWRNVSTKYLKGSDYLGMVVDLEPFGAFVELEDGLDGFVPINELSPRYVLELGESLSVGDKVRAIVTTVDSQRNQINLSIRKYLREVEDKGGKKYMSVESEKTAAIGDQYGELLESIDTQRARMQEEIPPEIELRMETEASGKVLVIDDEADVARSFAELARAVGYDTDIAFDGRSGVDLTLDRNYDAIVTDIDMPDMRGTVVMKQILERKPDACIILFSAAHILSSVSAEDKMLASGILQKPASADTIDRTIKDAISGDRPGISTTPGQVEQELALLETLAEASDRAEEISQSLSRKLQILKEATDASACAIFEMDPITKEVDLVAKIGIWEEDFEDVKYKLRYSPVSDVIMENERLFHQNIHSVALQKFQYLLPITRPEFGSCIGLSVTVLDQRRHGLFLFHPDSKHFTELDLLRAEAAAGAIASTIEYNQIQDAVEGFQRLMLIGQILSGLSHDIRNRLDVLSHYSDLTVMDIGKIRDKGYQSDKDDVDLLDRHIRELIRGKDRAIDITDMFLEITREDKPQLVEISKCIQRIRDTLSGQARHSNARIDVDIDENVERVKIEARAFEQILLNLVLNALQHIENEGITHGKVEIKANLDETSELPIKIRICDNGPGVHRKHFERIFDFGFTTRSGGAGMGLYLCKQLAKRLGGRIGLEDSVIFLGTTFILEIPRVRG